jgi:tetratricopeptide (TPR) repeat protein
MLNWVNDKIHPLAHSHATEERGRLVEWVRERLDFLSGLLDRTVDTQAETALALAANLWRPRARLGDARRSLEQLEHGLERHATELSDAVRSDVLNAVGACRLALGQPDLAEEPFAESLRLREALEDTQRIAASQLNLATVEALSDRVEDAKARLKEAQDLAAVDDHRWLEGAAVLHLANITSEEHAGEKRALQQKAVRLLRQTGDLDGEIGGMLGWLTVATEEESTQAWEYVTRIGSLLDVEGSVLDLRGLKTPILATADALRMASLEPLADRLEGSLNGV